MALEPPKRKLFKRPDNTVLPSRVDTLIAQPEDILGMTKEEFDKQKMLFSSEFLLGLAAGCSNYINYTTTVNTRLKQAACSGGRGVHLDILGNKPFKMPPKGVLFTRKPLWVPDITVTSALTVVSDEEKPFLQEKPLTTEIPSFVKRAPKKYSDYLLRAGLNPSICNTVINRDGISYVKVSRHLLASYRSLELPGIYFYGDHEDYSYLAQPKLNPWDVNPCWYLKSSEFTAVPDIRLGSQHVHEEHVVNALLMYSSRRGVNLNDRAYFKRHGTHGPAKYNIYDDIGPKHRRGQRKYLPRFFIHHVADYLKKRALSVEDVANIQVNL